MDTIQTFQNNTVSDTCTEQPRHETTKQNPSDVFIKGIFGVFVFVILYMLATKMATAIIKKKKNKQ